MADLSSRDIIFAIVEVSFALATVFCLGPSTFGSSDFGWRVMVALGCTGAIVPLLMRFSLKYWQGGALPKVLEMMAMIWACVLYFLGGLILIIARFSDDKYRTDDMVFAPACCALVTAIMCTVDLLLQVCGK